MACLFDLNLKLLQLLAVKLFYALPRGDKLSIKLEPYLCHIIEICIIYQYLVEGYLI